MRTMNVIIGCALLTLGILHAFVPNHLTVSYLYGAGALFALITLRRGMGINTTRLFAVGTTIVMFVYFAAFFKMAPHFDEHWYRTGTALEGVGMLLSAFAMIPVLSSYSCLLKADGCEHFKEREEPKRRAFFSVPEDIHQNP